MRRKLKWKRSVRLRITAADPSALLSKAANAGIPLYGVDAVDPLTVIATMDYCKLDQFRRLVEAAGGKAEVLLHFGLHWRYRRLLSRPVLMLGLAAFFFTALYLPGRILSVQISGNTTLPDRLLLEQTQACGLRFGVKGRTLRSEYIKNQLLSQNENLQWVGIDIKGCVATVRVRERTTPSSEERQGAVASIVAVRAGVISQLTAVNGVPLCAVGEQVQKDQTLISGYTDCGLKVQAGVAEGEVFAYTMRQASYLLPYPVAEKGEIIDIHDCLQLRIGKKLINFCNHSGIPCASCDKMYLEKYWTLPGGFRLPVSFVLVRSSFRKIAAVDTAALQVEEQLLNFSTEYLLSQMVAGKILHTDHFFVQNPGGVQLCATYACEEMIGQVRFEETGLQYAEDN